METNTTALSPPQPFSGQRVLRITGTSGSVTAESADSGDGRMASAQTGIRTKWSNADNRAVMRAYYKSSPDRYGYRQRMLKYWRLDNPNKEITEQRLADQKRQIEKSSLLSMEERETIRREMRRIAENAGQEEVIEESEVESTRAHDETPAAEPTQHNEMGELGRQIWENITPRSERQRLPPLKGVDKIKLVTLIERANAEINKMRIETLDDLNDIAYATARVITAEMGFKLAHREEKPTEPAWKRRIQTKISRLRRDLSQIESWKTGKLKSREIQQRLEKNYWATTKGLEAVAEELKQRLTAQADKLHRYQKRIDQFRQNRDFQFNQKKLYSSLQGETHTQPPNPQESVTFWTSLWGNPKKHQNDAEWIKSTKEANSNIREQTDIKITEEKVLHASKKMKNWKAPGPDQLHSFWLKKLASLHNHLAQLYQKSLREGCPIWMSGGRTILLQKDSSKGTAVENYRPITCLPTMWKLLSGLLSDEIRSHLQGNSLIPTEQKGCMPKCRGTKDQLLTDKAIVHNCKRRRTNLCMVWIDYKKAFDSVPHSWLIECMRMFKVNEQLIHFMGREMGKWHTELTSAGQVLGNVPIRRGIFQGDALSPLLFIMAMIPISTTLRRMKKGYEMEKGKDMITHLLYMDDLKLYAKTEQGMISMTNTVQMISNDIGMVFGLDKCAKAHMKKGKLISGGDMTLSDGKQIQEIDHEHGYKYLGILQADTTKTQEAKELVKKEYFRRSRLALKSQLNAGNTIRAINTWATPVIRYTAGVVEWTVQELKEVDRKTRKLLTMHRAFNMNGDVDRLYVKRNRGGKGLLQIEQVVHEEECALGEYMKKAKEDWLIRIVTKEQILETTETKSSYRDRVTQNRMQRWRNKKLHGQFLQQAEQIIDEEESMRWLEDGYLKKETESLLMAAQERALRTRKIMHDIDHRNVDPKCRLCGIKDETVEHLVSACPKLAQTEYKGRHDKVGSIIHWYFCKKFQIHVEKYWYKHQPATVCENEHTKILWDFPIQTDRVIQARRPDIVVVDKHKKSVTIIDIAVPNDTNINDKEEEKIMKYQDLRIEVRRLWKMKVKVVPIVIGALGSVPRGLKKNLLELDLKGCESRMLQKAALLGTARILRRVMSL
jgi:hypothetical protein